jgi:hypothetical protein
MDYGEDEYDLDDYAGLMGYGAFIEISPKGVDILTNIR